MGEADLATEIYQAALDSIDIDANSRSVSVINLLILSNANVTELYKTHNEVLTGQSRLSPVQKVTVLLNLALLANKKHKPTEVESVLEQAERTFCDKIDIIRGYILSKERKFVELE
jgi:hypothetical protein